MSKTKSYYHATSARNLGNILIEGFKTGIDGCVYLTKTRSDALKFIAIRCFEDIVVFEIKLPNDKVKETFDHSQQFFKCRAYGYYDNIPAKAIANVYKFDHN